ncbi:MAG: LPS export ABC transporter periplasmic protein LptC [Chitinophagales bacterium]|nr:LPS export ABC transporter periplasmic protein LptC [Chitinophagales bacterium]MDW8427101.1 LPS export ABC transporter periplasmic protein LptC [Chitinophagales bacterium]
MSSTQCISLLFLLWVMGSCVSDPDTIKRITAGEDPNKEHAHQVRLVYSQSGQIKAELEAPLMVRTVEGEKITTELPEGLLLRFFDEKLQEQSRLTADYGVVYEHADEMIARNRVVATNINGDKLETEELIWNQKTRRIYSDKFVRITTGDEMMFGDGFESNEDLTNYKIRKIRGTVRLEGSAMP